MLARVVLETRLQKLLHFHEGITPTTYGRSTPLGDGKVDQSPSSSHHGGKLHGKEWLSSASLTSVSSRELEFGVETGAGSRDWGAKYRL